MSKLQSNWGNIELKNSFSLLNVLSPEEKYDTLVFYAMTDDLKSIKRFLLLNPDTDLEYKNEEGDTLLAMCVFGAKLDIAKFLLKNKANPNTVDRNGIPILHRFISYIRNSATNYNFICLFQLLIRFGYNLKATDKNGNTLLHLLCLHNMYYYFFRFFSKKNNKDYLKQYRKVISLVIENEKKIVNIENKNGETPLAVALINDFDLTEIHHITDCGGNMFHINKKGENIYDIINKSNCGNDLKNKVFCMYLHRIIANSSYRIFNKIIVSYLNGSYEKNQNKIFLDNLMLEFLSIHNVTFYFTL